MAWFWEIFGGDQAGTSLTLSQTAARTMAVYLAGVLVVRAGKSRLLARATGIDILVGFILGSLLSRGINGSATLSGTLVASVVLVAAHAVLTAAGVRWHALGNFMKGHTQILIRDGVVLWDNLRNSHISEHDLAEALRLNGKVEDPSAVARAYKERNGEISVITRAPA